MKPIGNQVLEPRSENGTGIIENALGFYKGGGKKLGLRRTTVRTLKLRTSDKFGLRTSSDQSELFAPLARKLRTGPDWEVRTSDWSPNFHPAEKKPRTGPDWESSDFGLSPNFRAAQKKLRTGSDWESSDKFGLRTTVRTFAPRRTSDWIGLRCFHWNSKPFGLVWDFNANFGLGREVRTSDWKVRTAV